MATIALYADKMNKMLGLIEETIDKAYTNLLNGAKELGINISTYTDIYDIGYTYLAENYAWESAGYFWAINVINELIDSGASVDDISRTVNRWDSDVAFMEKSDFYWNMVNNNILNRTGVFEVKKKKFMFSVLFMLSAVLVGCTKQVNNNINNVETQNYAVYASSIIESNPTITRNMFITKKRLIYDSRRYITPTSILDMTQAWNQESTDFYST